MDEFGILRWTCIVMGFVCFDCFSSSFGLMGLNESD
jgi:hypothetical protein